MTLAYLAMIRFTPLVLAALMAWILCVCVHEFAHALVAYIGGDRTVKAKGYLSLDPTRFIDPMFSLLIPAVVLMMGGLPLPGGAVRIDDSSLKSRKWGLYVSAAGPASNFILFLIFGFATRILAGRAEFVEYGYSNWVYFCGMMAYLNFIATLFNLIPCPPLDGYRLIEHRFSPETQWKLRQPQVAFGLFGALFLVFAVVDAAWLPFWWMLEIVTDSLGLPMHIMIDGSRLFLYDIRPVG